MRSFVYFLLLSTAAGQTLIDLGRQAKNVDFSVAPSTKPVKTGVSLPATCQRGELFFLSSAAAGSNLRLCAADNVWSAAISADGATVSAIQQGQLQYCLDTGTLNSFECNLSPSVTSYTRGMIVHCLASSANNGPATLNLNGLGAKNIYKHGDQALDPNDIRTGQLTTLAFDGTSFQLQSPGGNYLVPGPSLALRYNRNTYPNTIDFDTNLLCLKTAYCAPSGAMDLSNSSATKPSRFAAAEPPLCSEGESYYNTSLHRRRDCVAQDKWQDAGAIVHELAGQALLLPWGSAVVTQSSTLPEGASRYYQFSSSSNWVIRRVVLQGDSLASGASLVVAIYNAGCDQRLSSGRITGPATGRYLITLDSPVLLESGLTYYFGWSHESTGSAFSLAFGPETSAFYNSAGVRIATGAAATGTGSGMQMPTSCGALNADSVSGAAQYVMQP